MRRVIINCCGLLLLTSLAQADDRDLCGAYCLYVGLKAIDMPVESFERLQEDLGPPPAGGYSLGQLDEVARQYGAETLGVSTSIENLRLCNERFACIAHLNQDHFVLVSKIDTDGVIVVDPPAKRMVPFVTWDRQWDGVALLLSPSALQPEEDLKAPWNWYWIGGGAGVIILAGTMFAIWKHQN